MALTDTLRRQHEELVSIVVTINEQMTTKDSIKENARELRKLLSKLAGKLKMHLAVEDKILYPKLLDSNEIASKKTAKEFLREMGEIGKIFNSYLENYATEKEISNDIEGFIYNSNGLFKCLAERIDKENKILYPLADGIQ
jgi:iron-sulfur cluster repair protein YtfE (RIC family)